MSERGQAGDAGGAIALIGVTGRDGGIELVGSALAVEGGTFRGDMVIDRRGAGGSVSTRQAGEVVLAPGERADIARVEVSYQPGDRLDVTVTLTRDGVFVAQTTLSTSEN